MQGAGLYLTAWFRDDELLFLALALGKRKKTALLDRCSHKALVEFSSSSGFESFFSLDATKTFCGA